MGKTLVSPWDATFCASTTPVDKMHRFSTFSNATKFSPIRPPLFHGKTSGNVEKSLFFFLKEKGTKKNFHSPLRMKRTALFFIVSATSGY